MAYIIEAFEWRKGLFLRAIALIGLVWLAGCSEEKAPASTEGSSSIIVAPDETDHFWVFAESAHELGSGGEFHIYIDPETHPKAPISFSKFALGVEGALPEHVHRKTEEIVYFLSGQGMVRTQINGQPQEVEVGPGHVWYVAPGDRHAIRNIGDEPLILVFAVIPQEEKGLLSFFRRIGAKPGEMAEALSPEEFATLAAEHDLILVPPEE